jgi:hypothetical protein
MDSFPVGILGEQWDNSANRAHIVSRSALLIEMKIQINAMSRTWCLVVLGDVFCQDSRKMGLA